MKLVRWTRFTWDLKKLPTTPVSPGAQFCIRSYTADEEDAVRKIIISSLALDTDWNDALNGMRPLFETAVDTLLQNKPALCLALTHGARVIGASLMTALPSSENHLVSGPCISMEYRNRGLGTALLYSSLCALRDAGLGTAHGITKQNLSASRYVYPKFGATSAACEFSLGVAEAKEA
jgi:predicted N-acetyltransferase YhbS